MAPIRKGKIHPVYTLRAQLIAQRREHLKLLGHKRVSREMDVHALDRELLAEKPKQSSTDGNEAQEASSHERHSVESRPVCTL